MAGDFEHRCFNQALFEKIRVYEGEDGRVIDGFVSSADSDAYKGVSIEADFAEPFATLLNSDIFTLKSVLEKNMQKMKDGQPGCIVEQHTKCATRSKSAVHLSFSALLKKSKTKTSSIFYGAGLSMDCYLPKTGIEPVRL